MQVRRWMQGLAAGLALGATLGSGQEPMRVGQTPSVPLDRFLNVLSDDPRVAHRALDDIGEAWDNSHTVLLLELAQFIHAPPLLAHLYEVIEFHTGQAFGPAAPGSINTRGFEWVWTQGLGVPGNYPEFKAELYGREDEGFRAFFSSALPTKVRLDEVLWTGRTLEDLPGLRQPKLVPASEAAELTPSQLVIGFEHRGEARAYPKHLLMAHGLVSDTVGGEPFIVLGGPWSGLAAVYRAGTGAGPAHSLRPSGFVYRSGELLYDESTKSLWSAVTGRAVIGRLAGQNASLEPMPVVSTTWADWRRRQPNTRVLVSPPSQPPGPAVPLSGPDPTLWPVPRPDRRLPPKTEVLVVRVESAPEETLALPGAFLYRNPVYYTKVGGVELVVLTDAAGANRVYETGGRRFRSWDRQTTAVDEQGKTWRLTESALRTDDGLVLRRLPAHRVWWHAWAAHYPETRLVK